MNPAPLLELSGLRAGYGAISVLHGIDLHLLPGEMVAIIGANGAGKTTCMMCISGIIRARSGTIRFAGADITRTPAHLLVSRGLAQVPEGRKIFPRMSVLENLHLGAHARRRDPGIAQDLERVLALFPILAQRRHQAGGTLSGGEQQMLAIGRALMSRPVLLTMDEPSMGVAPKLVQSIFAAIAELRKGGMSILLVEQNARMALALADRAYVLETGRVARSGRCGDLLDDPAVKEAYLGED